MNPPDGQATADTVQTTTTTTPSWNDKLDIFDIRTKLEKSPYTGCARESIMWSIATGTTMGLHRMRMKSRSVFSINVAFATALLVCVPSYYFCVKRLDHKDKVVKLLMKANEFETMDKAPETPNIDDDHPFLEKPKDGEEGLDKELYMYQKERKDWEEPKEDVFQEVDKKKK